MAGDILQKERTLVTLTSTGAALATGSAGAAGTDFDARASGNAADDFQAQFELTCAWATITNITLDTIVAELYLIPKFDGTNLADINTTASSSALPWSAYAGSFVATKAPTAATSARFVSPVVSFLPFLYTAYILNRSGQAISANWSLKVVSVRAQYS